MSAFYVAAVDPVEAFVVLLGMTLGTYHGFGIFWSITHAGQVDAGGGSVAIGTGESL